MTDGFRLSRIVLVPAAILVLFFMISPRMCARALVRSRAQQTLPGAAPAQTETSEGLKIVSSGRRTVEPAAGSFPAGLDAARIQYLVEIDPIFSAPKTASMPKAFRATDEVTKALIKMQYAEKQPDNTTALTREGGLYLKVADEGDKLTFPIANRTFVRVTNVSQVDDDKYDAAFSWRYEASAIGTELKVDVKKVHSATAEFSGGERHWALTSWIAEPNDLR